MSQTRLKSPLTVFEHISPNSNRPRNKKIRRLTPHCVAGNLTIESTLRLSNFQAGGNASTNYAIGTDGRIGLGVEETNRAWTSSSSVNDQEAITFEIANNSVGPDWRMSDMAINSWLNLAVEICKFYGYKKVNYVQRPSNISNTQTETWIKTWAKKDEMIITLHNWYANKACPGPYFIRQLPWLVREMNKRLQNDSYVSETFVGEGASLSLQSLQNNQNGSNILSVQPTIEQAEKIIWNFLKSKNLNDFAIAGIMGNLFAESGLRSNILQLIFQRSLNMTNESYTSGVDNGSYTNFVHDRAGYGLSQWTFHTRKQALLNAAKNSNTSIGDMTMQLNFMWDEMQGYKHMLTLLNNSTTVLQASNAVLLQFMKPADQSPNAQNRRAGYAKGYLEKFSTSSPTQVVSNQIPKQEIFKEYTIVSNVPALNIRSGPGTNYAIVRTLVNDKNVYTIIEEAKGIGSKKWGRLKSGLGWVGLDYTRQV